MESIRFLQMWRGISAGQGGANRIRDSGFRGENEEHPLSADVEWEAPQGRGANRIRDSGFRIQGRE
jgi:galactose mutarotase-like enzyme